MALARTILYSLKIGESGGAAVRSLIEKIGNVADATKAKVAAMGTAARKGLNDAKEEGEKLGRGIFGVAAAFTAAGIGLNKLLAGNREWDRMTSTMGRQLEGIRKSIADAFGPAAAGFLKIFLIGIAGIVGGLAAVPEAIEAVKGALTGTGGSSKSIGSIFMDSIKEQLAALAIAMFKPPAEGGSGTGTGGSKKRGGIVIDVAAAPQGPSQFDMLLAATANRLDRVGAEIPKAFDHIFAALEKAAEEAAARKARQAEMAGAIGKVGNVVASGGSFASLGGLSGNPVFAAIGGLLDSRDQIAGVIKGLDEAIVSLVRDLPRILLVDLPKALLFDLVPGLIKGLAEAIADAFKSIVSPENSKKAIEGQASTLDRFGLHKAADMFRNVDNVMGFKVNSFDVGTPFVSHDQVAKIHRGERIVPANQNHAGAMGNVTIIVQAAHDPTATARAVFAEFRRLQGNFGVGLTTDPIR